MRFDWYSATVLSHPENVIDRLSAAFEGTAPVVKVDRHPGAQGYAFEDRLLDPYGDRVCSVLSGGHNSAPHVRSSGEYSHVVASALRSTFPEHFVSRADVAIDFRGTTAWSKLRSTCQAVATDCGLKWAVLGDDREDGIRDVTQGRTFYVGARSSRSFLRGYEKGLHELAKGWVDDGSRPLPSPDWIRVEVEVKPPNRLGRLRAASLTPLQFWGCSPWTRAILSRIMKLDVERITMQEHRLKDVERSLRHAAIQYRAAMESYIIEHGGDDAALMEFFRSVWNSNDLHKAAA